MTKVTADQHSPNSNACDEPVSRVSGVGHSYGD